MSDITNSMHADGVARLLSNGLAERVREAVDPGVTHYSGPAGHGGTTDQRPAAYRAAIDDLRRAIPREAILTVWLCRSVDGKRITGQICATVARGSPAVVWSLEGEAPTVEYDRTVTMSFDSESDRLMAAADPLDALERSETPYAEAMARLLGEIGYIPKLPHAHGAATTFRRLELERRHDRSA